MNEIKKESLSSFVKNISNQVSSQNSGEITVAKLTSYFGDKTHAFVVIFFATPFLQPVPLPGLSVILGLVMAISGLGIITEKKLVLPNFIGKKKITASILTKIFKAIITVLDKTEHLIKPRFPLLAQNKSIRFFCGSLIIISGLFLALPLPPGTNFPPAIVCFFLAFGILESDFLLILIGISLFSMEIVLIDYLIKLIPSWF